MADVYNIGGPGVSGIALGGPSRDILYVVSGSNIINVNTAAIVDQIIDGTSVFVLRDIGATGQPSTSLSIRGKGSHCNKCDTLSMGSYGTIYH